MITIIDDVDVEEISPYRELVVEERGKVKRGGVRGWRVKWFWISLPHSLTHFISVLHPQIHHSKPSNIENKVFRSLSISYLSTFRVE
jgi:hypothetical protein